MHITIRKLLSMTFLSIPLLCGAATNYLNQLLPGVPTDMPFKMVSYGDVLKTNKEVLHQALNKQNVVAPNRFLIFSLAMVETSTMSISQKDSSKDHRTDGAINYSIFNLNLDMIQRVGYSKDPKLLDNDIPDAIGIIQTAIGRWGVRDTLDFIRGGNTTFVDHVSFGADRFRRTVSTILNELDKNNELLHNDIRVEIDLEHV